MPVRHLLVWLALWTAALQGGQPPRAEGASVPPVGGTRGGPEAGGPALQAEDGIASLVGRLEDALSRSDADGVRALLSPRIPADRLDAYVQTLIVPGATRAVVRERDRAPLPGLVPGDGYRLMLDVFVERGREGRVATHRADVIRTAAGPGSAGASTPDWRIVALERLTSIDGLFRLALDSTRQFAVRNLTVSAEDLTLAVPQGSAFVAETPDGVTAIVVLGAGTMRFAPRPEAERGQVRLFCGREVLETPITALFARVNPFQFEELLTTDSLTPRAVVPAELGRAQTIFDEEVGKSFGLDLNDLSRETWSLVPPFGDFLVEIRTRRYRTLTYARSGNEAEDITLFDRERRRNIAVYASERKLETLGRFYNEDELADYDVLDYDIEASFLPAREWIEARARVMLQVRAYALSTLTLRLHEALAVRGVVSEAHGRVMAIRVRGQNSLLVNLPEAVPRGSLVTLRVAYAGRIPPLPPDREVLAQAQEPLFGQEAPVVRAEPRYVFSNRSYWYPQATVTDFATARLRLRVPPGYQSVASGSPSSAGPRIERSERPGEPDWVVSDFVAGQPLRYLSWLITRLAPVAEAEVTLAEPGGPGQPATATNGCRGAPVGPGAASGPGVIYAGLDLAVIANPRQVGRGRTLLPQVEDILRFYATLVRDVPYPSFTLALVDNDVPGGHSPAYFALLYQPLPTTPFSWRNDPVYFDSFPQFFLAHELAHQFWGQAVGWQSYHDQWLSEGFAQYFAALYAERRGGTGVLADVLRRMRRSVFEHEREGPIWLGYRLGHIRGDSRPFRAIVYNKSAMVLHMLRRLIGDDAFFEGLRSLYWSSRFTKAGTDDVRRVFEAASGRRLERFFDGWVLGTALPRIGWSWAVLDGGREVSLRFEQAGTVFDLPVAVTLSYADGTTADHLVLLDTAVVETRLPLRGALRSVAVNGDEAALARFDRRNR